MPSSSKKGSQGPVSVPQPPVPETVMIGSLNQPQKWRQSKTAPDWLGQSDPSKFDQHLQRKLGSMMPNGEAPSKTNLPANIRFLCVLSCLFHPEGRPVPAVVFTGTAAEQQPEDYEVLSAQKLIKVQVDQSSRYFLDFLVVLSSKHQDIYLGDELLKWMFNAQSGVPEAIFWDALHILKARGPIRADDDFPSLPTVWQMMKVYKMLRDDSRPQVIHWKCWNIYARPVRKPRQAHRLKTERRPLETYQFLVDSVDRIIEWMDADKAHAPHPDPFRTALTALRSSRTMYSHGVY